MDWLTNSKPWVRPVEIVAGVGDLRREGNAGRLVDAALDRFGRLDSAAWFTGRVYGGTVTDGSLDALEKNVAGNLIAPFHALQATLLPMIEQGSGQVLLITSAAGLKPTPGAGLYFGHTCRARTCWPATLPPRSPSMASR